MLEPMAQTLCRRRPLLTSMRGKKMTMIRIIVYGFFFFFFFVSNLLGGHFALPERLRFRVVCCAWLSLGSGGVVVCVLLSSSDEE